MFPTSPENFPDKNSPKPSTLYRHSTSPKSIYKNKYILLAKIPKVSPPKSRPKFSPSKNPPNHTLKKKYMKSTRP